MKSTTRTTRPMGKASKCLDRERMESQETKAKTTARTSSRKKVSFHNSFWRFSNCSNRGETPGRASPPGEERTAEFHFPCSASTMKARRSQRHAPRKERFLYKPLQEPLFRDSTGR